MWGRRSDGSWLGFAGPDQMTLEVACSSEPIDPARWIDPAVLAKAGISAEEAEGFKAPAAYDGPSPVPQPAYAEDRPHMAYPKKAYLRMLAVPDEVLMASASFSEPPVKAGA